jgi:C-3',4' desaturase CrtD
LAEHSIHDPVYDLAVVGGGIGGLALAALAQRAGLRTILCESHTKLGGCAGYFQRENVTFDCGATALMGLQQGEPIRELLNRIGMDFEGVKTPEYRMCLPDGDLVMTDQPGEWESTIRQKFPHLGENAARFWRIQEKIGKALFKASSNLPRSPIHSVSDIFHNLKILGLFGTLCSTTTAITVKDLMRILGLHKDPEFVAIVAMLLQDTAQAGPETVPLANAAACLQAYRFGLSRPKGSMKALAEGIGEAFSGAGGDLRTATLVDSVRPMDKGRGFIVKTRRGHHFQANQVAMNLPLDIAARLLDRDLLKTSLGRKEHRSRAQWSAFTTYAAIEASHISHHKSLFHHVLQDYQKPIHDGNNVLISLSPEGDEGYCSNDLRLATMSTHVRAEEWSGLDSDTYQINKTEYANRMKAALERAFPGVEGSIRHIEFASPRSFARYTRRTLGRVGGPPVSRSRSNLMGVDSGVLGKGLWVVGDSVFPGQGTMAVVMCAMRVLERITGKSWYDDLGTRLESEKKMKKNKD